MTKQSELQLAADARAGGVVVGHGQVAYGMQKVRAKAAANNWVSNNLGNLRTNIALGNPVKAASGEGWTTELLVKKNGHHVVGVLEIRSDDDVRCLSGEAHVKASIENALQEQQSENNRRMQSHPQERGFFFGDGIAAAEQMEDKSVDLLLTDPPYVISKAYTCEKQIPRRLRSNGADFIMPKGDFGTWDHEFSVESWTKTVLPKVGGWAAIFCAQAQIGEYTAILEEQGFNAVGTIVWWKTNPVPFNHRFKPINAWEAGVIGKRPGTKFHGKSVHNVFRYKSPSPQQRFHPTQKPLGLMEELMELFSSKGQLVFDPFAGAATTACAAIGLEREVIAFENNPEHYDAACRRLARIQVSV